jgi:hypothetical protein
MQEDFKNEQSGDIPRFIVIPNDLKTIQILPNMRGVSTMFGYRPHPESLRVRSAGHKVIEQITLTLNWGTNPRDLKMEPVLVSIMVPEGIWRDNEQKLIVNLEHLMP